MPQELEHPGAQLHEFDDGRGSKVLAVEPAQLRRPLLLGQDEPMLGEPEDHLVGPVMRHASDPGDLPDGERRIRPASARSTAAVPGGSTTLAGSDTSTADL